MAVFSVYDYDRKQFDYYQTPGNVTHQALGSVKFSTFRQSRRTGGEKPFGNIAESIAYKLPADAKKIGEGFEPRGVIASSLGESANMFEGLFTVKGVIGGALVIGVGYILWHALVPK